MVKGIGATRLRILMDYFGNIEEAWKASIEQLQLAGISKKLAQALVNFRSQVVLDEVWKRIEAAGISILTWEEQEYPARLHELDQPPPVLYLRGSYLPDDDWAVAIVGTRRVTAYGRQVTEEITRYLSANGITIVSGLARGVDFTSHLAALNAGGRTLAILGSGVDRIYPPEHIRLAERIVSQGALISDYPPGTPPDSTNFPPRNRIISGLAKAVVVVEAGESSGALITAAFAVEQGREVFAVPAGIHAPQSKGANRLIQQGARLLMDPQEILEVLNMTQVSEQRNARSVLPADATEAAIFSILSREPRHIDEIRLHSGLPIEKVSSTLTIMELKGMVRQVGGMQYIALRETPATYE